jgi:hypothetical protein
MIRTELYNEDKHYDTLAVWWKAHGWEPVAASFLPKRGVVVYNNDTPITAGFLFQTDSPMWLMEWVVGNPNVDKDLRAEGLDVLISSIITYSKLLGSEMIYTMTSHKRLQDRYISNGFIETDKNMNSYLRRL